MIYGIGVDNCEIIRIEKAMSKRSFVERLLTTSELEKFDKIKRPNRQAEFLAGIWAAKEAYSKAYGTGYGNGIGTQDMALGNDRLGKPYFSKHPYADRGLAHVSMTHDGGIATAIVILESPDKL